ncbi:histidine phosphatase superfamily [Aspergillus cavernicola]|uniref:Histidine phosphatase superfamily n=1 Tax=Aspergillus cavernicola TaxID=176166 RepID=A0ABR4I3J2_9EURO
MQSHLGRKRKRAILHLYDSHHLRNPLLTETGKAQCQELQEKFPFLRDVEVILASPLRRTIQTAAFVFAPELKERQIPVVLVPNAQEISRLTCDLGYDADVTKAEAPSLIGDAAPSWNSTNLDMTLVDGDLHPHLECVKRRAAEMRNWIYNRSEKHIALVTHGGFLHYFTEDWTGCEKAQGTGYLNCEYRKLEFTEDSTGKEAHLRESGSMLEKQSRPAGLDAHVIHEIEEVERASE